MKSADGTRATPGPGACRCSGRRPAVRWAAGLGAVTAGLVALPVLATALVFAPPPSTGARAASGGGTTRLAWAEAFSSRIGAASPDAVRFALAWVTEEGA